MKKTGRSTLRQGANLAGKLALNAGWDEDLLRGELADLRTLDFNIDLKAMHIKCMHWFEACLLRGALPRCLTAPAAPQARQSP